MLRVDWFAKWLSFRTKKRRRTEESAKVKKKENVKLDVCLCRTKSDTKGRMKQGEIKEENERIFFVFFHFAFCSVLLLFF